MSGLWGWGACGGGKDSSSGGVGVEGIFGGVGWGLLGK